MSTSPTTRHSTANAQLSLFSELTDAELGDNSIEESIDDRIDYTPVSYTHLSMAGDSKLAMQDLVTRGEE